MTKGMEEEEHVNAPPVKLWDKEERRAWSARAGQVSYRLRCLCVTVSVCVHVSNDMRAR